MILVCMVREDSNQYYSSKQHHFVNVDFKMTGGGNHPRLSDTMLQKVAQEDQS